MTYRQFRAWQDYLKAEWNEPDRHDHYLLRVCQVIIRANGSKETKIPELDELKIKFAPKQGKSGLPLQGMTAEQRAAIGKARGRTMIVQPTRHQDQHGRLIEWLYPIGWTDRQKADWLEKVRQHEVNHGRK